MSYVLREKNATFFFPITKGLEILTPFFRLLAQASPEPGHHYLEEFSEELIRSKFSRSVAEHRDQGVRCKEMVLDFAGNWCFFWRVSEKTWFKQVETIAFGVNI